jgi:hypothetical protein
MRVGLVGMVLVMAGCVAPPDTALVPPDAALACITDREALLALDIIAFDQTRGGGWRRITDSDPACELAAADLIAEYRARHSGPPHALIGHEAEVRASNGQTERALDLFREELAFKKSAAAGEETEDILYGEATIAFLESDRAALIAARDRLAALPMPPGMAEAMKAAAARYGLRAPLTWPPNLGVTENLVKCFGRTYREAFDEGCPDAPG